MAEGVRSRHTVTATASPNSGECLQHISLASFRSGLRPNPEAGTGQSDPQHQGASGLAGRGPPRAAAPRSHTTGEHGRRPPLGRLGMVRGRPQTRHKPAALIKQPTGIRPSSSAEAPARSISGRAALLRSLHRAIPIRKQQHRGVDPQHITQPIQRLLERLCGPTSDEEHRAQPLEAT